MKEYEQLKEQKLRWHRGAMTEKEDGLKVQMILKWDKVKEGIKVVSRRNNKKYMMQGWKGRNWGGKGELLKSDIF